MNKYVSSILKVICALIIILNASIISLRIVKTDENKHVKMNYISYLYDDIDKVDEKEAITSKELEKVKEVVKTEEKPKIETPKEETKNIQYAVLETFTGSMTGYGPDCAGCGGRTSSGYDLRNGNIYYQDATFGKIRIVAADKMFAFGTIVRVSGLKVYDEPFLAIVLDRGGAIKGTKMDLAFDSESNPLISQIGYSKNIQYEVLRYGW